MNFEITYWGPQAAVTVSRVTFPRGKPVVGDDALYADIRNYFPNDIEARAVGAHKWHYQAPRLKVAAPVVKVESPKTEPTVVEPKPPVVELPKTEPTITVDVTPVDVSTAEVVEPATVSLTIEEQVANLIPDAPADVVTQIVDELVSGSATQESIMALAGIKARVARRILKIVGGPDAV